METTIVYKGYLGPRDNGKGNGNLDKCSCRPGFRFEISPCLGPSTPPSGPSYPKNTAGGFAG